MSLSASATAALPPAPLVGLWWLLLLFSLLFQDREGCAGADRGQGHCEGSCEPAPAEESLLGQAGSLVPQDS